MESVASLLWAMDPDSATQPTWLLGAASLLLIDQRVELASFDHLIKFLIMLFILTSASTQNIYYLHLQEELSSFFFFKNYLLILRLSNPHLVSCPKYWLKDFI